MIGPEQLRYLPDFDERVANLSGYERGGEEVVRSVVEVGGVKYAEELTTRGGKAKTTVSARQSVSWVFRHGGSLGHAQTSLLNFSFWAEDVDLPNYRIAAVLTMTPGNNLVREVRLLYESRGTTSISGGTLAMAPETISLLTKATQLDPEKAIIVASNGLAMLRQEGSPYGYQLDQGALNIVGCSVARSEKARDYNRTEFGFGLAGIGLSFVGRLQGWEKHFLTDNPIPLLQYVDCDVVYYGKKP